jgi:hypothetical protein
MNTILFLINFKFTFSRLFQLGENNLKETYREYALANERLVYELSVLEYLVAYFFKSDNIFSAFKISQILILPSN